VNRILRDPFPPSRGRLAVPAGPGLGIQLDEDAIDRVRLA